MGGYALVAGVAAVVTLAVTPLVRWLAVRFGAVVTPSQAKHTHTGSLPTLKVIPFRNTVWKPFLENCTSYSPMPSSGTR